MRNMLGIAASLPALPPRETREVFIDHYGRASAERVDVLAQKPDEWFDGGAMFFDVPRSRAWVLTRRFTHSAHHRGQLMVYLRLWGQAVYSTYGPTADTGGLFQNGARVIYRDGAPGDPAISCRTRLACAQPYGRAGPLLSGCSPGYCALANSPCRASAAA